MNKPQSWVYYYLGSALGWALAAALGVILFLRFLHWVTGS
jgi:hypothetical protein